MIFKIGDKVVYPNHGVGVIEEIQAKRFGEREAVFYALRILANDSTVLVPTDNTTQVGLRRIIAKRDIPRIYRVLQDGEIDITQDWKGRYQENCDRMRTGSIVDVATVLKNLTYLSQNKPLSYRERKMLDKARYLIVSEIAEVQSADEEAIAAQVDAAISKSLSGQTDH